MTFTVMISTRDRCADLESTCRRLQRLKPAADEVIICADGCRDDTAQMLQREFPQFQVLQNARPLGSMYSRDRVLRVARGEVVLSFDDDSYPVEPDFLRRLAAIFADHPEAAVVVFPELRGCGEFSAADKTDKSPGHYVSAYANCAAAMRRSFYLKLGGFPLFFEHMYEEPDYALQCYAAGASVWFDPSLTVYHGVSSVNRQPLRRHHLNARNELWSVWLRCPWPGLALLSAYRVVRQFVYACSEGWYWALQEPRWWWAALRGWHQCARLRQPYAWPVYYHWLKLARNPIYSAQQLRKQFP